MPEFHGGFSLRRNAPRTDRPTNGDLNAIHNSFFSSAEFPFPRGRLTMGCTSRDFHSSRRSRLLVLRGCRDVRGYSSLTETAECKQVLFFQIERRMRIIAGDYPSPLLRKSRSGLVKFDASPTARKYRRCRSSIVAFHYAEKACSAQAIQYWSVQRIDGKVWATERGSTKNIMSKHAVAIRGVCPARSIHHIAVNFRRLQRAAFSSASQIIKSPKPQMSNLVSTEAALLLRAGLTVRNDITFTNRSGKPTISRTKIKNYL
jgi:hypothetical protein